MPAKKTTKTKKNTTKKTVAKKTTTKKAVAKKTTSKKVVAKKAVAKKTTSKKVAAKKVTPIKKAALKKVVATTNKSKIAPYKAELELWYVKNKSFKVDILIIICTAVAIMFPKSLVYRHILPSVPEVPKNLEKYFEMNGSG